jgi:hypothetical protein
MIFLSYAREDRRQAAALEIRLSDAGYEVAKDEPRAESNAFWRRDVLQSMRGAQVLLVVWSRNAFASPWVDQETRAFGGQRVWYTIDDADSPADEHGDVTVHSWPQLDDLLSPLMSKNARPVARPRTMSEAWRRRKALTRAVEELRRFRRKRQPQRALRECSERQLVMESSSMAFRHVTGEVFLLDRPVTVRQYRQFLDESGTLPHPAIGVGRYEDQLPVTAVSWFEAVACAEWFGGTLPTESEWQHAADASRNLRYATASGELDPGLAWFGCDFASDGPRSASSYPPNPAGFHGMCGNTWDWCRTAWADHRVIRGGSWMDRPQFCTVVARYRNAPLDRDCTVGFRVRIRARQNRSGHYELIRRTVPR